LLNAIKQVLSHAGHSQQILSSSRRYNLQSFFDEFGYLGEITGLDEIPFADPSASDGPGSGLDVLGEVTRVDSS
jgi:hypothetical protein